ncbi:CAP domain-containing protein [Streptomyces cacaoi]|uniref:CAP domain-containing protein n=1 Tax=Streptomyces cacaoi TaxID=1898 RepID=UPI003747B069
MGKHRKKVHYRRIIIAVVTMGTVGVPSVALACTDWRDSGKHRLYSAEESRSGDWWNDEHSEPRAAASQTPIASASAPSPSTPKPKTTSPSNTPKATTSAAATPTPPRTSNAAAATPTPPSTSNAAAPASGTSARIVQLVNAERSKVGCSPLRLNAVLTKAAQAHSKDMAAHQNMSHTGSDGSSPGDRITRAGYDWSTYGENVAYGYATPEQVMAGWMSSPGHKANILNCAFKEIGVGLAQPGSYWTQDFATAR